MEPCYELPEHVANLSEQMNSDDDIGEDTAIGAFESMTGKVPEIVVSTVPAELIATDGRMQLTPVEGTGLLYASNTPGRLFLEIESQEYFVLLSGRWFEAKSLSGPWTYVGPDRPSRRFREDSSGIPVRRRAGKCRRDNPGKGRNL